MNTPRMPASMYNRLRWNAPTRSRISVHEQMTAIMPRNRVSNINTRLSPSTARCRMTSQSWYPGFLQFDQPRAVFKRDLHRSCSNPYASIIASRTRAARAIQRGRLLLFFSRSHALRPPTSSMMISDARITVLYPSPAPPAKEGMTRFSEKIYLMIATIPKNRTARKAMPIAYQRKLPVCVLLRALCVALLR